MKTTYAVTTLLALSMLLAACGGQVTPTRTPTAIVMETATVEGTLSPTETVEVTETTEADTTPDESGTPSATRTAGASVTIEVSQDAIVGPFLVDEQGLALYVYANDTTDTSTCMDDCAAEWPPLLITGAGATAGTGVDASKLGTAVRSDGGIQVTYNGHPLYYFADDMQSGDMEGHGVNDFFLISPEGEMIEK
jgi:predicted lipoprotein with Yx(FWY)xxD motif